MLAGRAEDDQPLLLLVIGSGVASLANIQHYELPTAAFATIQKNSPNAALGGWEGEQLWVSKGTFAAQVYNLS